MSLGHVVYMHYTRYFFLLFFSYGYFVWVISLILLTYKVTDAYVRLVCMHVIYLPVLKSFAAAVAVSPFPPPPETHQKQVLEVRGSSGKKSTAKIFNHRRYR